MTRKTLDICRRSGDGFFFFLNLRTFSTALEIFEIRRPELHLCKFYRVLVALPVEPVDPLQEEKIRRWEIKERSLRDNVYDASQETFLPQCAATGNGV